MIYAKKILLIMWVIFIPRNISQYANNVVVSKVMSKGSFHPRYPVPIAYFEHGES
jgi:hypothetical protein